MTNTIDITQFREGLRSNRLWYNHEWEVFDPDGALLRLPSRMAGTKELPEVCKPNCDLRGRKSVHVQLEQ